MVQCDTIPRRRPARFGRWRDPMAKAAAHLSVKADTSSGERRALARTDSLAT
ncbi:hypothetical protein C882_2843 [Caenispirillum salinarum AK4]|uniref:Uncharacterized protein n=1 Tax=Caenispirillum salinarum AK4 TaxID=1238182 RepID=K9GJV8_9PROT|nr:hypothetical protein C882_2843 [Caenispirillum salinarum AK4]